MALTLVLPALELWRSPRSPWPLVLDVGLGCLWTVSLSGCPEVSRGLLGREGPLPSLSELRLGSVRMLFLTILFPWLSRPSF